MSKRIILLRHGESIWNAENRFTGWTDVDLTDKGISDAERAGELMRANGFLFGKAFSSVLKRAVKTLNCVLDKMDLNWIPIEKSWRLNEKHYGELQGLNKAYTAQRFGERQVLEWRRSYDTAPPKLDKNDPRNPFFDIRYQNCYDKLPLTESLKDTIERMLPFWEHSIFPDLAIIDDILVVAHGNSLKGIVKHLKHISDDDIVQLDLPTATPYVFEFDENLKLVKDYFLGDPKEIDRQIQQIRTKEKQR